MRYLLAFLLVLAPLGASQATVSVSAEMGGNIGHADCANANSVNFNLDQGTFSFFCASNSLTYSCTAQDVSYATETGVVTMTCSNGSAKGLVVNAMIDGVQDGDGNNGGGNNGALCNNANNFTLDLARGKYTWSCDNGGGNNKSVACYTSQELSHFDTTHNQVNMDCVTLYSRSSFEDFELPPDPQ